IPRRFGFALRYIGGSEADMINTLPSADMLDGHDGAIRGDDAPVIESERAENIVNFVRFGRERVGESRYRVAGDFHVRDGLALDLPLCKKRLPSGQALATTIRQFSGEYMR